MMPAAEPKLPRRRSRLIYWLAALLLAAVFLYYSLRGIQWRQVWEILAHANLWYVALGLALSTFSLLGRAVRWRILLRAGAPIDVPTAFWATAAGYFGNNFLPARAGELVRTLMISARSGLSKTFVLTTALSERLSDAITLVTIGSVVLLTLPTRPGWFQNAARPFAILGLCGAFGIAVFPKLERLWRYVLRRLPLARPLRDKLLPMLEHVLTGLRSFHDAKRLSGFISLTLVIWLSDALSAQAGMRALGLSMSLPVALLLLAGLGLGSALPATPGYVGIFQFVAVSVLTPFGFTPTQAIAYILLAQAAQYVLIGFWGTLGLARSRRWSVSKTAAVWSDPAIPAGNSFQEAAKDEAL